MGELHSPVFRAPVVLECFLAGYPGKPGLDLYLERISDHRQFPLTVPGHAFPAEMWRPFYWWLPSSFRGQSVQLVAVDHSTVQAGWMGVSAPRAFSLLALLHQQLPHSIFFVVRSLFTFVLFLLPGFALAALLISRRRQSLRYALILICGRRCGAGLCLFLYFFPF